jgi:hypothetical protein
MRRAARTAAMNKVHGEPVHVQARADGRPVRFVWHDRLYTVRAILEHWVISREWWQDPKAEPEGSDGIRTVIPIESGH